MILLMDLKRIQRKMTHHHLLSLPRLVNHQCLVILVKPILILSQTCRNTSLALKRQICKVLLEPKDNQKKQECINNLNITTESKQSQQHKDTAADTSVHSDLPTAAQQQSMNNNKSRESQKEPGAATSSHDPLTKHTGSSDGNGEEASAMSGEKDSSKKEDFTPAVKKKKAKKVF